MRVLPVPFFFQKEILVDIASLGGSEGVQVKTSPSQNAPWSKRPRIGQNVPKHEKKIGQNVPIKRPHYSMEIFRRNMGFQQRKGLLKCLVLMYESLKWCFDGVFYVHAALDQR